MGVQGEKKLKNRKNSRKRLTVIRKSLGVSACRFWVKNYK